MTVEHVTITDPNLHEPKGVAAASADEVYVADGAGSGAWGTIPGAIVSGKQVVTSARLTDVSTASNEVFILAGATGTVTAIYTILSGAIATADVVLTSYLGIFPITTGTVTITQSGSAAGDVDTTAPTAQNSVTIGDAIRIETDGASTNAVDAECFVIVTEA